MKIYDNVLVESQRQGSLWLPHAPTLAIRMEIAFGQGKHFILHSPDDAPISATAAAIQI